MCWSSSPGRRRSRGSRRPAARSAIAGEFVTSVSSFGGSLHQPPRERERARGRVEEDRRAVARRSAAACAAIASLATRALLPAGSTRSGSSAPRGRLASERAPPCTRSTRPSRASSSRSRWTVTAETAWSRARSATDTPPSRWMRCEDLGAAQRGGHGVQHAPSDQRQVAVGDEVGEVRVVDVRVDLLVGEVGAQRVAQAVDERASASGSQRSPPSASASEKPRVGDDDRHRAASPRASRSAIIRPSSAPSVLGRAGPASRPGCGSRSCGRGSAPGPWPARPG